MKEKLKISFYLRANYFNKLGESPINIRVFLNGEKRYFGSTGFFINKYCCPLKTKKSPIMCPQCP